jgi:hypothetical protein
VRRKRLKKRGFLADLAKESMESRPEVREVIPVQAEVIKTPLALPPPRVSYHVKTTGEGGYEDRRFFGLRETGSGWVMEARWQAKGSGLIPTGFEMLGHTRELFNYIFNMLSGVTNPIIHQEVVDDYVEEEALEEDLVPLRYSSPSAPPPAGNYLPYRHP